MLTLGANRDSLSRERREIIKMDFEKNMLLMLFATYKTKEDKH